MLRYVAAIVFALLTVPASAAFACDPPGGARAPLVGPGTASPTVLPFYIDSGYGEPTEVTVTEDIAESVVVPGRVEVLREGDRLWAFFPDEPMQVGKRYTLDVTNTGILFYTIVEDSPSAAIIDMTPDVVETGLDRNCCDNETTDMCADSCGVPCRTCWPTAYEYRPRIETEIDFGEVPVLATISIYEAGGEVSVPVSNRLVTGAQPYNLFLPYESEKDVCVGLEVTGLDGETVVESEDCIGAEEFPDFERREPEFPEDAKACIAPPDDPTDPVWQRHDDKAGADGGCTTAGGSMGWPTLLFALLIGLRRRY